MAISSESASPSALNYIWAGGFYMISSISMFLVNKLTIQIFPFTHCLLFLQNTVALVILLCKSHRELLSLARSWKPLRAWLPAIVFFTVMLVSSLKAMMYVSVPTMIVCRNMNNLSVALGDKLLLKRHVSLRIFGTLLLIVLGTLIYAQFDLSFNLIGYAWVFVNLLGMACYSLYVKTVANRYPEITQSAMSFYNNTLSLIPFAVLAYYLQEITPALHALQSLSVSSALWLAVSCCLGFFISYAGFGAQRIFSATAWVAMSNFNKIPAILLGVVLFHEPLSGLSVVGLCVCMLGGFLYAYEEFRAKQQVQQQPGTKKST